MKANITCQLNNSVILFSAIKVKTFPSSGLLAFAMESQDIAAIFREENSTLVIKFPAHEIFLEYINIC